MQGEGRTVGDIGERAIIGRIRAKVPPAPDWVTIGIGDDAAVLRPDRNRAEAVTADALVEGVHFDRATTPPAAIGHKALAVNLSDLAAMGAEPRAALLSLVLPASLPVEDLDAIVDGLLALAARHGVALVGGNVTRSPGPLVVDVTATGSVKPRRILRRSGARPGDAIYVSGDVGAAAAGLLALRRPEVADRAEAGSQEGEPSREGRPAEGEDSGVEACRRRFLMPEPRVRLGLLLGRAGIVTSCVDLSDGLADAVRQVGTASRTGSIIDAASVPVPGAAKAVLTAAHGDGWLDAALSGGEDYELLFTVPPRRRRAIEAVLRRVHDVPCTRIGYVTRDRRCLLRRGGADAPLPEGFVHFR